MIYDLCRGCGEPAESRLCAGCQGGQKRKAAARNAKKYSPAERVKMSAVTDHAKADRSVVCWLCLRRTPPASFAGGWDADHYGEEIHPAHQGCNRARGNRTPAVFRQRLVKLHPDWFGTVTPRS